MFRKKGGKSKTKRKYKRKIYNIPDEEDIRLHQEKVEQLSKTLDDEGKPKPLTENAAKQLFRSAVRKRWMSCPSKLAFLESKMVPDYDPNTRRLWKVQCNICGGWFGKNEVNVDHIIPTEGFTSWEEGIPWAKEILDAGGEGMLQILCEDEHNIKSLSEMNNITFEEAKMLKPVIELEKSYKKASELQEFLMSKGFSKEDVSNKEKRRECIFKYLNEVE